MEIEKAFRRYLAARVVSVAGSVVSVVALPVLVYQLTGSAGWTSAVAVAEALPYLLFGLVAGAVADRAPRRVLMVGLELATAVLLASVPLAWWLGLLTAVHVLLVAFAVQVLFVFFDAANFGALPTLVGRAKLTAAYSKLYGATTIVEVAVPPLAGLAVVLAAPAPLMALNAVTAVASALLIRAITRPLSAVPAGERPARLWSDIGAGLGFLRREPVVRLLTLVGMTHAAAGGAWVAMLVPFADQALGVRASGDARLAVLFACWGIGGVLAARLVPRLGARFGPARFALTALPCSLLAAVATTLTTHWLLAVLTVICWGTAHSAVVLNAVTYRQQLSPDELQARVNTTGRMLAWGVGQPAGAALAGAVAVTGAGARGGLVAGTAVLAAGVAFAWLSPTLRARARTPEPLA
ncbi:MFS transporter [Amycolatopsis albispora]|uniref:MFS transporter n=1 Tax=Amycolatopsis albispora TaxID=1804986 RepID=UPI001F45BEDA|nr:MFS transporter [Amycolatopsis albispora]